MKDNTSSKSIKLWSEEDRPREKLMEKGVEALSDSELLAILIGSGTTKLSAVELCKNILASCDFQLEHLSKLRLADLLKFNGIGEAKAITILAAMELGRRRTTKGRQESVYIRSSRDAYEAIGPQIMDLPHEEFWILILNGRSKLLKKIQISAGGMNQVLVDPRIVFRHALDHVASSIILVHNHPSGEKDPSQADKNLTSKLIAGGKLIEINVFDHIIVAGHTYFSFADEGILV